ncbi:phosphodiester glycosidase family protein [Candidatus Woesearchaeota archaeon]|nr:phosphodiester glycosidase family protein [Candidatus Woesearchaeota archaeon]
MERRDVLKGLVGLLSSMLIKHVGLSEVYAGSRIKGTEHKKNGIVPIKPGDVGIKFPNDIPQHGPLEWTEPLPGFLESTVEVIFHGMFYDSIKVLKIDPRKFKFGVHNNLQLMTIEAWRESLDALAVINGSYYSSNPYGEPSIPLLENGTYKGPKRYVSNSGMFIAEPKKGDKPKATFIDFGTKPGSITSEYLKQIGYLEAVVSYPVLLDSVGNVRVKNNPAWRATRTFIGMDKNGYIILGNTKGGFFSLHRLGHFLKSVRELNLGYVLNLDGGPPACMDVKAGKFRYTNYGAWETNDASGEEKLYWNDKNASRWKIPNVISVKPR